MGEAIGQMLPFAFGVALSPMPIVAIVLMLITPKATSNGLSFLAGWVVGVAAAGAIVLAVAGPSATSEGQPEDWTFWLKLVLGVLLFVVGIREWRERPGAEEEVELPKWMSAIDRFTPAKAAGMGVLLSALNPKNLIFIVGGATVVAQAAISGGGQAVVWALFTLIASIGVLVPVAIYFALGERASALLDDIKTWMARNNAAVMAVLILVIGVKLIGDGIAGLSA